MAKPIERTTSYHDVSVCVIYINVSNIMKFKSDSPDEQLEKFLVKLFSKLKSACIALLILWYNDSV